MLWRRSLCLLLLLCRLHGIEGIAAADAGVLLLQSPEQPSSQQQAPAAVIIMAQARSGSTMLGQLFRQNEGVLYFYEPCRADGRGVLGHHEVLYGEECFSLARRLTRCEFTLRDSDRLTVDEAAVWYNSPAAANVHRSVKTSRQSGDGDTEEALSRSHGALMETCKTSRAVVAKTIRLLDGVGGATAEHDTSGVHVLHLVRDPRPVVLSQLKMRGLKGFQSVLPNFHQLEGMGDWRRRQLETRRAVGRYVCQVYRKQLESPEHLDGDKYLRIRYEDFSLLPQVVTKLVYCWAGLGEVPPSLAAWVDDNTRMDNCEDPPRSRQLALAAGSATGDSGGGLSGSGASADFGGGGGAREGVASARGETRAQGREKNRAAGSTRTGNNLRHGNRVPSHSALDTAGVRRLSLRYNRHLNPSGAAAVKLEGADVGGEGLDPQRLDSAPRGVAAAGMEEVDDDGDGGGGGGGGGANGSLEQGSLIRRANASSGGAGCNNRKFSTQNPFGTKRHSSQMIDLWRTQMPAKDAEAVWDGCLDSNVMQELRYSA